MVSLVKKAYRSAVPVSIREDISSTRDWWRMFLNYAVMRSSLLNFFSKTSARPNTLYIEGTNICNARCIFCAYPQMERPKTTMPMEVFRNAVDQHVALGLTEVDLTPIVGDPFVDKFLFERMDYLAKHPQIARFHFYSNAILMKPEYIERLVKYDQRFWIFLSFGGFERETYHQVMGVDKFDEAVSAIRGLIERKVATRSSIRVQVNLRIPKGNEQGEFWDYLCRRRDEGVIEIDSIADFDNWGGKITDEMLQSAHLVPKPPPIHRGPCRRLLTGPVILADGRVNACACRDVEATLIIGDLKKESLGSVLSGDKLKELLDHHERNDFPEICKRCTRYESLYPHWMQGTLWRFFQAIFGGFHF